MRLEILNKVDAEEYASETVGGRLEDYGFTARVDARASNPETAYEAVNRSTALEIQGLTEIGRDFGEHEFPLDVAKSEYTQELQDITAANDLLQDQGLEYATDVSVQKNGETPGEAMKELENTAVRPVLIGEEEDYSSVILYHPDQETTFQPSVHPTDQTTPDEALERREELEEILRALNLE